jgi:hypothetical protein
MDQVRQRTKRGLPLKTTELIVALNPLLRGWGEYYKRAHVRKLFQRLVGYWQLGRDLGGDSQRPHRPSGGRPLSED